VYKQFFRKFLEFYIGYYNHFVIAYNPKNTHRYNRKHLRIIGFIKKIAKITQLLSSPLTFIYGRKNIIVRLSLVVVLIFIATACVSCWSPLVTLIIENQTSSDLTVYVNAVHGTATIGKDREVGNVCPCARITDKVPWDIGKYCIRAKNAQGEIVFSEILCWAQMEKIEDEIFKKVYKVVIKPKH
jgi:hypothetical protein